MSEDLETLLQKQKLCFENIKTIVVNYGKTSKSRKTPEYLKKRLEALNLHWSEFVENHNELLEQPNRNIEYFIENIYAKTESLYSDLKQEILAAELAHAVDNPTPQTGNNGQEDVHKKTDVPDESKKLLRQQLQNFAAFQRTVEKIDLKSLQDKWELEDSLSMLKSRWEAIDKLHWDLDFLLKDTDGRSAYAGEYRTWENTYDKLKREINLKIWADKQCEKSTPKVHIPEFHGNYNQWISFRDLFTETIHASKWLTKSQKMQHLKSKLKGEPEKLVQHLTVSADNYDSCWEIIKNRYENKRLLFSSFMNTVLSLPNLQVASAAGLKKMHDTLLECVNGLTNLGIDISTWDPLLVHLLLPKLDSTTYADYIHDLEHPRELPELADFFSFLEAKFLALETLRHNQQSNKPEFTPKKQFNWPQKHAKSNLHNNEARSTNFKPSEKWTNTYHASRQLCPFCKKNHYLMKCFSFINLDASARNQFVTKNQICKNCLFDHHGQECFSEKTCKNCSKKHHTLLHVDSMPERSKPSTSAQRAANHVTSDDTEVLLTTVQLMARNAVGDYITLRALLDQGSQVSLITENAAQRLRLKRHKLSAVISGIGTAQGNSKGLMTMECKSIHSKFTFNAEVLVMNKLINNLPSANLNPAKWEHLSTLKLADPEFHIPGPIDVLLGADIYSIIIQDGVLKKDNCPVAQHTKLGWILSGNVSRKFNCLVVLNEIDNLNKFWECEEINNDSEATNSDDYCENFYAETTTRLPTGQYVVKMPMKEDLHRHLGKSKTQAVAQFLQLERKMTRQEHFANKYRQFIAEYEDLGHMTPAARSATDQLECFLPHHGVIREESVTTKLRVVFNASMKTDTQFSLNDLMEKGPNLQKDISTLIMKWRSYRYALTADIEKMFRAIFLHKDQRPLQKIIWRLTPHDPLQEMELTTVTYGTKAAPYLAMRTLKQLADDEGCNYPLAEKALRHQFYMDDVITGHDTVEEARALQKQLYDLLQKGGFILRKWASNDPAVLKEITETQKSQSHIFNFKQDAPTKMLGIGWNTASGSFCFDWEIQPRDQNNFTKRMLLSDISKLYDPLGWLAPIVISVKLLFQELWSSNLAWDEQIPDSIARNWEKIRSELNKIRNISIPRWINCINKRIELHGFSDASEKAYACVIYTKTVNDRGDNVTTLLTSKTKVAPLKTKSSLPRLELCGALLLAKLMEKTVAALSENQITVHCWTDSQVVLAWLQGSNKKWEKYVANRVATINSIVPATQWKYVNTKENPADCATRGLLPSKLINFPLWWKGPQRLLTGAEIENKNEKYSTNEEVMYECCVTQQSHDERKNIVIKQLLERHSSISRAIRCLAWVLRFIARLRHKTQASNCEYLSKNEINNAMEGIVKHVQREHFLEDINNLHTNGALHTKSKLLNLTPFIDEKGILRVGGRLRNSNLSAEAKHPMILPHSGRFTELIIDHDHKKTLHGGVRLTLAQTRQRYWILGGNRAVKARLRLCVRCHRFKTSKSSQIMGNLPFPRVSASRPFTHCGVDFTGHVDVKLNKGRGVKTCKGYVAIFICLATKAVHIELVSDLSTHTFLAALKRLCARRGTPKHMYSDNGTNFKGAAKILHTEFQEYQTLSSPEFFSAISEQEIEWHFLCPHWPSAAGVWEAAVKSTKYHLMRVLGEQKLDFEQFTTLLAQIEGCLNSRPLCPLTEDVDDLDYLTPGHFLTGTPMMSLPQESCSEKKVDLRNKWKLVEQMHQHIWHRWSNEYLHQLQTKSKWLQPKENINVGDLVTVKEDNQPPGKWAMARVLELHPGTDGYVRVVTIKTKNNILKRPITKLAPLPKRDTSYLPDPEKQSPTDTKTKPHKRQRSKLCNFITLMTLSLFSILTSTSALQPIMFTTTQLTDSLPMYFDEIGDLQLIHNEWTLLVYYNLTTYWQGTTRIEKYINNLENLCLRMEKMPCEPVTAQLKHELQQLTDYNSLLLSQHLSRKKRGYFNGVGNLARTLFGVLDDNFAKKYHEDIAKVKNNEDYLLQLLKNQTSIVETENNIIKNNEQFMERQFEIIHDYITRANDTMSKIVYKVELMSTMTEINAASLTASLILSNLKRTQELLLDTLVNVHNGHLDLHLLTPKQLTHELHMISARKNKGLSLPIKDVERNIKDIYKLIYVKARVTASYLLLELHIPLTSDDEYQLYHIISLPIHQNNGDVTVVRPTSTHIAINRRKKTYISVEQDELHQCVQIKENSYVCNTNYPIYNLNNIIAPCEAKMLGQQTNIHCDAIIDRCYDAWVKLHRSNSWIYICCNTCHAYVICENNVQQTTNLTKIGIVDLTEGCVLQKQDSELNAYTHFGSKVQLQLEAPNVPNFNFHSNQAIHLNISNILPASTLNQSDKHKLVDEQIYRQRENEHLLSDDLSTHDVHQFVVLYFLVGGACAAIIWLAVKHYRKLYQESKSHARPKEIRVISAPENHSTARQWPSGPMSSTFEMTANPVYQEVRKTNAPVKPKRLFDFDTTRIDTSF